MAKVSAIQEAVNRRAADLQSLVQAGPRLETIIERIASTLRAGGKILTCGNGGSAAEALHLAEEMVGRFSRPRAPLSAVCLSADSTALTCIANDYGFEQVFARQVEALAKKGDALVALSTSGRSQNILRALEKARQLGVVTLGLLGNACSPAEPLCDAAFTTPASNPAHVQEMHLVIIHLILERLEETAAG